MSHLVDFEVNGKYIKRTLDAIKNKRIKNSFYKKQCWSGGPILGLGR